jgi:hypothetical protein
MILENKSVNVITDKRWELKLQACRRKPSKELLRFLPRWQTNSSPSNLGVVRFGFELFPHLLNKKYGTAQWVRPALATVLDYHPSMRKIDRAHAICTYRDGSKSTWFVQILASYLSLVGYYGVYWEDQILPETDYIRIRAKTQEEAEKKITNVTSEFTQNQALIDIFGDLEPNLKDIKDKKLKNQAKLLILKNGHVWQSQGLNQPSRGALVRGKRPKLDINDDVENKENTKTKEQRKYNATEILGEQFGGLSHYGMSIYIGNYVHEDCLMKHLLKNPGWKPQYYQISYFDKDGIERSGWAARYSMEYIKRLEEWYVNHPELGGRKIARMEYWNEIISEKDYDLSFVKGHYVRQHDANWVQLGESKKDLVRAYVVVSGDPAISKDKRASFPAITVTAFCSDGQRYVLSGSREKYDNRDRYHNPNDRSKVRILAITPSELGLLKRRGMVEEMARQILKYNADGFVLENAGQQLAWYNDLEDVLSQLGLDRVDKLWYHPKDEKVYKLEVGLMNYISAGRYHILENAPHGKAIKEQVDSFPESTLDLLDALHNAEELGKHHLPNRSALNAVNDLIEENKYEDYETPYDVEESFMLF